MSHLDNCLSTSVIAAALLGVPGCGHPLIAQLNPYFDYLSCLLFGLFVSLSNISTRLVNPTLAAKPNTEATIEILRPIALSATYRT
jgi:hypothetical protein